MPIHPIGEKFRKGEFGSPYSIKDYYAVDPNYGTLDDFKKLVAGAHQRGMKVIMDLVANHTAWDSVMMTQQGFLQAGRRRPTSSRRAGLDGCRRLELQQPRAARIHDRDAQVLDQEADVDGFRCDVASMVPTDFWEQARAELSKVKPDIMMLAEASKPELLTNAFDLDYSWPLLATMNNVLMHDAPASDVRKTWEESCRAISEKFPAPAHLRRPRRSPRRRPLRPQRRAGRVRAHVHARRRAPALQRHGSRRRHRIRRPGAVRQAEHFLEPEGASAAAQHLSRPDPAPQTIPRLRSNNVDWLHNSDESQRRHFLRADDKDEFLVVINFSNRPVTGKVDLKNAAGFSAVKISGRRRFGRRPAARFHLNGFEWRIYHRAAATVAVK